MADQEPVRRYRFGIFEADASTGELRRKGMRVKLNSQPFQLLLMLLERPGEVVSREEIAQALWRDGTFVDFEHGVNSAINRLRDALGDAANAPRFIETLARRGYRFVAPVERIEAGPQNGGTREGSEEPAASVPASGSSAAASFSGILATPEDLPHAPSSVVRILFLLFQLMYIGFYVGALANMAEIAQIFAPLSRPDMAFNLVAVSAAVLLPVRAFLIAAVFFHPPGFRERYLRLWPALLLVDVLWALSPFLLMHHIDMGLAIACMALLVYAPFAQRSLVLMGAVSHSKRRSAF